MVRGNLGVAMQGLVVVPLFVGYDEDADRGRIFSYDVAGGPYKEQRFYSIGSGSLFARGALKKLYVDGMPARDAVLACVQALYDAAGRLGDRQARPDQAHLPGHRHDHGGRLQEAARIRVRGDHRSGRAEPDGPARRPLSSSPPPPRSTLTGRETSGAR